MYIKVEIFECARGSKVLKDKAFTVRKEVVYTESDAQLYSQQVAV